LIADKASVLR